MRFIPLVVCALSLSACGTMPAQQYQWVHDSKPISEYDSDTFKCISVARQVIGQPMTAQGDVSCRRTLSGVNCADNSYMANVLMAAMSEGDVEKYTNECMQRQGWRKESTSVKKTTVKSNVVDKTEQTFKQNKPVVELKGNRNLNSACLEDAQCTQNLKCVHLEDKGYKTCQKITAKIIYRLRNENAACLNDAQCFEGLRCLLDADAGYSKCKTEE